MRVRSSTSLRVRCTPGGTLRLSRPGRCCSSPRRGSRDSLRRRGCRGVTSPPRRRLPHQRTFRGFWRSGGGTIPNTRQLPPGKITVLAPKDRHETGTEVRGNLYICRDFSKCRRWDSNPHEVALTGFFESDKDCGMARDAALRGAFMSLFASLCGIVRVLVRPDSPKVSPKTSRRNLVGYRRAQTDTCTGISAAVDGP